MTRTILLRLAGPQQSWGSVGSSMYRTTETAPTRSGIEGLLCAALGAPRGVIPSWVRDLDIHVRVDRPGRVEWDFHTVNPVPGDVAEARGRWAALAGHRTSDDPLEWQVPAGGGTSGWKLGKNHPTMLSRRAYLADAEFIVAITGDDQAIESLHSALRQPTFSPYLGRRAFAPAFPFLLGTHDGDGVSALSQYWTDEEPLLAEFRTDPTGRVRILRIDEPRAHHVTTVTKEA